MPRARILPPARIVEVKRTLDGRAQRFDCDLVHRARTLAVVRFRVHSAPWAEGAVLDSYGCFWMRRPYACYYMVHPSDGRLAAARFDVVRDVEVDATADSLEVRYTDLLLDLWVQDGVARWEDDDDLAAAIEAGRLSDADRARIDCTRALLDRGHPRITAEIRRLLRDLGRLPA